MDSPDASSDYPNILNRLEESISYREPFKSLLQECIDHSEAKCRLKARTVNPYVFVCILAGSEVWEQGGARNELWLWSTAAFSWVSDVRYGDSCQCEYARDRGLCKTPSNTSWLAFTWRASQKDNLTVHTDAHELPFSFWALRSSHLKKCDSARVACKYAACNLERWRFVPLT